MYLLCTEDIIIYCFLSNLSFLLFYIPQSITIFKVSFVSPFDPICSLHHRAYDLIFLAANRNTLSDLPMATLV